MKSWTLFSPLSFLSICRRIWPIIGPHLGPNPVSLFTLKSGRCGRWAASGHAQPPQIAHIVWRRQWQPTPVLLPIESHGRRSLVGYSPRGRQESDTTERLHFHFSLSCIGEGNGNPLLCSCLENPRDGGAWWASVYGVAQSQTRLKRLSSSSSPYSYRVGHD